MPLRKSDYENYDYQEFWQDNRRYYEDLSERIALRKLIGNGEENNSTLIDIGCGFGRLFNEYSKFPRIVMVDYSLNNLKNARLRVNSFLAAYKGRVPKVLYVAADATRLPFKNSSVDTIITVRVIHHLEFPGKYFDEVVRILRRKGIYILEFANKRNFKNILRFMTGRLNISPFNTIPLQVGETIRNYHPKDIFRQLIQREMDIEKIISVSNYRAGFLKRILGNNLLILLERMYQSVFPVLTIGPSVFLRAKHSGGKDSVTSTISGAMASQPPLSYFMDVLQCPGCNGEKLEPGDKKITCTICGRTFECQKSIIDFRL